MIACFEWNQANTLASRRDGSIGAVTDSPYDPRLGIGGPLDPWCQYNLKTAFESEDNLKFVAPFPPAKLMFATTGLTKNWEFSSHGVDILRALTQVSPVALAGVGTLLEFGVGVGRLARMFKGFRGRYVGADIDKRNVSWLAKAMPEFDAVRTAPRKPLPFDDETFEAIVSVSVFTHMTRADHLFYLDELRRVAKPGAYIFLTVHGERALSRATSEEKIFKMLSVERAELQKAQESFARDDGYHFVQQGGHLTSTDYTYGMTFISDRYIRRVWNGFFEILDINMGAIHNFQDIVVMRRN
jgi:SAM-dependent methyltransferase